MNRHAHDIDTCRPSSPCGRCDACFDDGAVVLDQVRDAFVSYVAFPSPEAADAVTLHVAATHAQSAWEHATRLVIKSPVRRCGKTRLLEVAVELCHQVLATTNISTAALVRSIGLADPPTIVLDEADAVFATRRGERSEGAEDLRGILNSGHARGWPYIRWDPTSRSREECPTFAMAILAGIGDLPDTIEDRSVIVTMRRRAPGETVARFRRRRSVPPLHELRTRLHSWVRTQCETLAEAEPDLPVEDRAADVWEPLVAIADAAGGEWPARARAACRTLAGTGTGDDADATQLLADLCVVFGGAERLSTATLLERLNDIEASPWGGWHRGDGLNARDLSRMLRPYPTNLPAPAPDLIAPRVVNLGETTARGYLAEWFHDAWSRYVPAYREAEAQRRNGRHARNSAGRDVTDVTPVTQYVPEPDPDVLATVSGNGSHPTDDDLARWEAEYPDEFDAGRA